MKHRKFVYVCFVAFIYLIFCGHACSPADQLEGCGLYLEVDMPKDVDSMEVLIYGKDSLLYVFRDTISCSKCYERKVWITKSYDELEKLYGLKNGEYEMKEIVYCNGRKTVFPSVPFTLKNGESNFIQVRYASDESESWFSSFIPENNACNVEPSYKLHTVLNKDNCVD